MTSAMAGWVKQLQRVLRTAFAGRRDTIAGEAPAANEAIVGPWAFPRTESEAAEAAAEKFAAKNRSKALKRFLKLSEQAAAAGNAAPPLPYTFFGGVESDLAELCIRTGK